jgi:hypothetical protein
MTYLQKDDTKHNTFEIRRKIDENSLCRINNTHAQITHKVFSVIKNFND